MKTRANDATGPAHLVDYAEEIAIECPRCASYATVVSKGAWRGTPSASCGTCAFSRKGFAFPSEEELARLARRRCPKCNRWVGSSPRRVLKRRRALEIACECGGAFSIPLPSIGMKIRDAVDPYYGYPLWYRKRVGAHEVWAYNRRHLGFLKRYLEAELRERAANRKTSLATRLPGWIKKGSRRQTLLRIIEELAIR